jgi:CBS domain-containing protein
VSTDEPGDARLPRTSTEAAQGLTVADVMHANVASMAPTVTVGELRRWFAGSASRRLAVIADDGRYAAALTPADLASAEREDQAAIEVAAVHATLAPQVPAITGRDLAIATAARRVPVVDDEGRFLGVLALTRDLRHFACRPLPPPA